MLPVGRLALVAVVLLLIAANGLAQNVSVGAAQTADLKLYRMGNYPVIRGTALPHGDRSAYLWTSVFVPRLDTYMGPERPNPIMVRVQRGECDLRGVLVDVMGLTKINFNSCLFK
jgi:hypothetical protein